MAGTRWWWSRHSLERSKLSRIPVWAIHFFMWDIQMPWSDPALVEHIDRPIVAISNEYPPAFELDWHQHRRGQLLYAARGVVVVSTPHGAWVAPPERAIWTPGGVSHAVRMVGEVSTRSVLIEPDVPGSLGNANKVIPVSPLLRHLLEAACDIPPEYDVDGRDGLVMSLLLAELARAPTMPLAVPFPQHVEIARKCRTFLEAPSAHDTIDQWSSDLGMGRRAFTRAFRRETGLSFGAWRQQACLLIALPRLAAGDAVTTIAFDLGYESPAAFTTMFKRLIGVAPSHYRSNS
ncbi:MULTISPECIES: helix-turn-helix domain-containing protein [unclassified Novosphingobium]|uniref:AraC family transcriptional regulator n=1 Tax=unclassified Novosphingobium TaxID=2644732 RepID=UPI0017FF82B1|nr:MULTISPECIES: helix-turn-helix transcriptional regulator [unclassified Novosphingobium]MBB3356242.1 AraC-like DNA-binding protein [Novosphingobium sp. BK256]MBB3372643.1 AraC-like DNA-binding protein [Novosphingobium sp. BK280]MBB3377010.1 AraC-like DNA-binding protein [Novosphingobium sp. BK258]MBB3419578.1 AraC-like DNA-binding protein [Novosphingobium sp. BK267]MBB3448605.1 AraC-like DNA-binding protein [Novosphingobium sp. BK352]